MDSIGRLGALVMGILVLQLSLVAGPAPCAEPVAVTETGHAGMSMPAEAESRTGDVADGDCTPGDHAACQAVMSCAAAVFQPAVQSQLAVAVARGLALADPASLFQTRSTVPDLPPPRA